MLVFTLVAILLHGMKTSDTIIVRQVSVISCGLTWALDCSNDTRNGEETSSMTQQHLAEKQIDLRKNLLVWGWEIGHIRKA